MARIRTIKPEMPSDEKLASVCRDARLTFAYLITQADDDGLVPAAPRQLLGMLFPHDADVTEAHVMQWCDDLAHIGSVRWRQTKGGTPVLELVNWSEHQKIKHRAKPVLLPSLVPHSDADSLAATASGHTPLPRGSSSGGSREDWGRVSPTNQQPATMDHGPTTDRVPATNSDQGPGTGARRVDEADGTHRVALAAAANKGIAALYGEQPMPYRWDHPGTFALASQLASFGVELTFARRCLYTLASTKRPADDRPPRSLKYYADAMLREWSSEQQRRQANGLDTPEPIALSRPSGAFAGEDLTEEEAERRILAKVHAKFDAMEMAEVLDG